MAAQGAGVTPGMVITHPNREKAVVQGTRAAVIFLLLASAGVLLVITGAGWEVLESAQPVEIAYILIYLLLAFLAFRWNRGALPISASLAVFLLIFAAVAAPGWFEHQKHGFSAPSINSDMLGILTLLLIPLQVLLVIFAMRGFAQGWNVELEQRADGAGRGGPQRGGLAAGA
ncbi:MAG: hypothetical protein KGJ43_08450 [Acidobacteriota bacterium]|nr:hypothetical protein [Acidobacteriota bacterium]